MAASSAPALKASLLAILKARPGLAGVNITWAHPGSAIQQDSIWLDKVSDQEAPVALGRQTRDENYTVTCVVFCVRDGDDAQTAEVEWWRLAGEVELALQADVTVGGVLTKWALVSGMEQRPITLPGQRGSEGEVFIACQHRK